MTVVEQRQSIAVVEQRQSIRGQWSSPWVFIMAATGSAVGLGNIWRFPYIAGEYGGGAFVLTYLACVLLVGIPIMISEVMLGRRGRKNPINTLETLSKAEGLNPAWRYLGWMGVVAGFLILSFYSVIAGWTLEYIFQSGSGNFLTATDDEIGEIFNALLSSPVRLLAVHTLFMALTIAVVAMGVQNGLERAVKFLMPALFVLLVIMVGYAMCTDGFQEGMRYLFYPDWSKLSGEGFLVALGQAFFSLSLGMGAIMVYGSYMPRNASIVHTSVSIALVDMFVAIMAGIAIFPLVFTYGLDSGQGPGLIFVTLPIAFGQMPYGQFFGTGFFILLMVAAWTSSISLLEPAVAWLVENRGINRVKSAVITGLIAWVLGIGSVLSFNLWQDYKLFDKTYFSLVEYATSTVMLPLGGLLIAIFAGWLVSRKAVVKELGLGEGALFQCWLFAARYVAPLGVVVILFHAIGLF